MKKYKQFLLVVVLLLAAPAALAQSLAEQYRLNSVRAQHVFLEQSVTAKSTSRHEVTISFLPSIPESVVMLEGAGSPDVLLVGDWSRGIIAVSDIDGDGEADTMNFFYKRSDLQIAEIASRKRQVSMSTLDGRLLRLVDIRGFADKKRITEFVGLASGDALLPVPEFGQIWFGNSTLPNVLQYSLESVFSGAVFPEQKLGIASRNFLPGAGGSGSISYTRDKAGNLYSLDLSGGCIWQVPFVKGTFAWERIGILTCAPMSVGITADETGALYVLTAESFDFNPPPASTPPQTPPSPPTPPRVIPSQILRILQTAGGVKVETIWVGWPLRVNFSPLTGLAVRNGKIYAISQGERGSEVLLFEPVGERSYRASWFVPSYLLGGTTLAGLAFLN